MYGLMTETEGAIPVITFVTGSYRRAFCVAPLNAMFFGWS
jgi:hypothetical protein